MKKIISALSFTAMEELEQQAIACWEQMHVPGTVHSISQVTSEMPAFLVTSVPAILYVCFPTYKVDILLPSNVKSNDASIELLLAGVAPRSRLQPNALDYAVVRRRCVPIPVPLCVSSTVCLGSNLKQNVSIRDKITEVLDQNGISYMVYPVYQHKPLEVEILKDEKTFIVL